MLAAMQKQLGGMVGMVSAIISNRPSKTSYHRPDDSS